MRLIAVLVALIVVLELPAAASSGPSNDPLAFSMQSGSSGHQINQPVDFLTWCGDCGGVDYTTGSPWVVNPTNCMWDSDDNYSYTSSGNVLAAGASVSVSECLYGGGAQLPTDIVLQSSSPNLLVTETWTWTGGGTVTAIVTPILDQQGHAWRYFDCIRTPVADGPLVTIPDSNGGQAVPGRITVVVSNPTSQKVGKTGGALEAGGINGGSRGCVTYRTP